MTSVHDGPASTESNSKRAYERYSCMNLVESSINYLRPFVCTLAARAFARNVEANFYMFYSATREYYLSLPATDSVYNRIHDTLIPNV